MTNFERIKSMTVDELAELLFNLEADTDGLGFCDACEHQNNCEDHNECKGAAFNVVIFKWWLNREA